MIIRLSWDEIETAAIVAVRRYTRSRRAGRSGISPAWSWNSEIESAAAEMAVARGVNRFWSGSVDTFRGADVLGGIQVRYCANPAGHLLIRAADTDTDVYVFVTHGQDPAEFVLRGWIRGVDAKQGQWFRAPDASRPPCYVIPLDALKPIGATPRGLAAR